MPVFKLIFPLWLGILFFLPACQTEGPDSKDEKQTTSVSDNVYFLKEDFSQLKLDSTQLVHLLDFNKEPVGEKELIVSFYRKRNFQFAWLEREALSPAAHDLFIQYQDFMSDYGDSSLFDPVMDSLLYQLAFDGFEGQGKGPIEQLEVRLSLAFFRYAKKEFTGLIENPEALNWHIPKYKRNYAALLDSLASGRRPGYFREPANAYYTELRAALGYYKSLEKSGRWPRLPGWYPETGSKTMDPRAGWLKQCLVLTKDLQSSDTIAGTEEALRAALKNFQKRMGLKETGQLDKATYEQLLVPPHKRLKQIMVNLERMRWLPEKIQGDFLVVNIPEFALHVFKDGKPFWDSRLVVGKQVNKTQVFSGAISHIIHNPQWAVPPGIVKNEVLPGLKKHSNYLKRHHMRVFSGTSVVNAHRINWHKYTSKIPYTIRQLPGKDNPLGKFKFLFPNSFWIYLHDSNEPYRFEAQKRTFSHGCIRVEEAEKLAAYLLEKNAGMGGMQIQKAFSGKGEAYYKLQRPEPVYILYLTSWVGENGQLNFRPDVYGRDSILAKAVFGNSYK